MERKSALGPWQGTDVPGTARSAGFGHHQSHRKPYFGRCAYCGGFLEDLIVGLEGYLREIDTHHQQVDRTSQEGIRKDNFYTALTIGLESFQAFIRRYRELAIH